MLTDDPGQPPWRTSNNAAGAAANEVRKVRINSKHISVYDEITGEETADTFHDLLQTGKFGLEFDIYKKSFLPFVISSVYFTILSHNYEKQALSYMMVSSAPYELCLLVQSNKNWVFT